MHRRREREGASREGRQDLVGDVLGEREGVGERLAEPLQGGGRAGGDGRRNCRNRRLAGLRLRAHVHPEGRTLLHQLPQRLAVRE